MCGYSFLSLEQTNQIWLTQSPFYRKLNIFSGEIRTNRWNGECHRFQQIVIAQLLIYLLIPQLFRIEMSRGIERHDAWSDGTFSPANRHNIMFSSAHILNHYFHSCTLSALTLTIVIAFVYPHFTDGIVCVATLLDELSLVLLLVVIIVALFSLHDSISFLRIWF